LTKKYISNTKKDAEINLLNSTLNEIFSNLYNMKTNDKLFKLAKMGEKDELKAFLSNTFKDILIEYRNSSNFKIDFLKIQNKNVKHSKKYFRQAMMFINYISNKKKNNVNKYKYDLDIKEEYKILFNDLIFNEKILDNDQILLFSDDEKRENNEKKNKKTYHNNPKELIELFGDDILKIIDDIIKYNVILVREIFKFPKIGVCMLIRSLISN